MTQLMKYTLRLKNKHKDGVVREFTVLAPGAYVAALWCQEKYKSDCLPVVITKGGQAFDIRGGNHAYRRALRKEKLAEQKAGKLDEKGSLIPNVGKFVTEEKLTTKQKSHIELKDQAEVARSRKMFHMCELIDEKPYKEV